MSTRNAPVGPWEVFLGISLIIAIATALSFGALGLWALSEIARLLRLIGIC